MDEDKFKKLDEKLYSNTPLLGDRIRQQALKELIEKRDVPAIESLTRAFVFYKKSNFGKKIASALSQLKLQEVELINAVCRIWSEERDPDLGKILKLKGWVASRPTSLRLLTAINLGWQGVIEEKGIKIIKPLLACFEDEDSWIENIAREWSTSLTTPELQDEVCRLATEEDNQTALEVSTSNSYAPSKPEQAALFWYFTQQWEQYQTIDPKFKLLEEIYYTSPPKLQKRIDEHGQAFGRLEWLWMRLGGKEGRRLKDIEYSEWENILKVVFQGQHWEVAWSLLPYLPTVWTHKIVTKLASKRLSIKNPEMKLQLGELSKLWKSLDQKTPPQGQLVRLLHTLQGHSQIIKDLVVSPDSKMLISAGGTEIMVWDLKEGNLLQTLKGHLKSVTNLCFNADGSMLASGSRDKTICLWRLPEGHLLANLSPNNATVWSLNMTSDARTIASAGYREIRLWKYPPGSLAKTLTGHTREVEKVIISHHEDLLISAGGQKDNTVRVWSLPDGEAKYTLTGHEHGIWDLAITPDDSTLASAGKDHQIKLWSLGDGQEITTLKGHQGKIWCLGISPNGQYLVSGSDDNTVKVWTITTGKLEYNLTDHHGAIVCLDISSDSQLLVTGSTDGTVKLWNLSSGELMTTLTGHQAGISVVKFSANGETLITGSEDSTIQLWRWDLSRLAHIPLMTITPEDEQWLKNAFDNDEITPEEKQWLTLIQKLLSLRPS